MATEKILPGEDIQTWKELALADTLVHENGLSRVTITHPAHEVILWDSDQAILRGLSKGDGNYVKVRSIPPD